jgi:CelD/BcsL family acetyltransferase involved in cellulose biosynthesis
VRSMCAKTGLEIERIEEIEDLDRIKEDWNALLERNETKTIELTYEWQMTYWRHFNENSELFVLIVKEGASIVAIAPFKLTYTRRLGVTVRSLEFIAARESNYQDFIIRSDNKQILERILDYLTSMQESWDILNLTNIPETSTTAHFLLNGLDRSLLCRIASAEKCVFLKIDKAWEEYAEYSKKTRKHIAYRKRRLQKLRDGEVSYLHCSSQEQLESDLQRLFDLHRKRWNQTKTPSQFNDDRYCKFYLEVVPQLQPKGQIDLFVLRVGDSPVALSLNFLCDRSYLGQLMAYDPEYEKGAPATVMLEMFVKQAFADGIEMIDFGYYHPYKENWANCFKNRLNIEIYPKRVLPCYIYLLTEILTLLRTNLRKITPLRRFVRYSWRRLSSVTRRA